MYRVTVIIELDRRQRKSHHTSQCVWRHPTSNKQSLADVHQGGGGGGALAERETTILYLVYVPSCFDPNEISSTDIVILKMRGKEL